MKTSCSSLESWSVDNIKFSLGIFEIQLSSHGCFELLLHGIYEGSHYIYLDLLQEPISLYRVGQFYCTVSLSR